MPRPRITSHLNLRRTIVATGFQTEQKLVHIKAILEQNGITDLSMLGKLQLGRGANIIPTPGLLTPPTTGVSLLDTELQLSRVNLIQVIRRIGFPSEIPVQRSFLRAHKLKSRPFHSPVLTFATSTPIPLAYWAADEVEIPDGTKIVFTSICKELYIVANKVKLGANVEFTWQEPSDHSRAKPQLLPPSQPRQTKRPDSEDEVIHGTEREDGKDGNFDEERRYRDGVDAPGLEIWTLDLEGRPIVHFRGQDGRPGQDGQDGSKGQNGADGISGKVAWTPFGGYWCERQAGSGGNGAPGGNG